MILSFQNCSQQLFTKQTTDEESLGVGPGTTLIQSFATSTTLNQQGLPPTTTNTLVQQGLPTTTSTTLPNINSKGTAYVTCVLGLGGTPTTTNNVINVSEMGSISGLTSTTQEQIYIGRINLSSIQNLTGFGHIHSWAPQTIGSIENLNILGQLYARFQPPANYANDLANVIPTGNINFVRNNIVDQLYLCGYNIGVIQNLQGVASGSTQVYIFGNVSSIDGVNGLMHITGDVGVINNVTRSVHINGNLGSITGSNNTINVIGNIGLVGGTNNTFEVTGNINNISNASGNIAIRGGSVTGTITNFSGTIRICDSNNQNCTSQNY
jgi:hypothetical protein